MAETTTSKQLSLVYASDGVSSPRKPVRLFGSYGKQFSDLEIHLWIERSSKAVQEGVEVRRGRHSSAPSRFSA